MAIQLEPGTAESLVRGEGTHGSRRSRRPLFSLPWRLRADVGLAIGCTVVGIYLVAAIFAPFIAPYNPNAQDFSAILSAPSLHHLLGTDQLGRDLLSRIIYGARVDLLISAAGSILACILGTALGSISGYVGRWVDVGFTRLMDMFQVIPFLIFAPVLLLVVGANVKGIIIAFALSDWVVYARLSRSRALVLRDLDFVSAARLGGLSRRRILRHHLLPNLVNESLVFLTMDMVIEITSIAALGYLGIGVQPPTPEWGQIMYEGQAFLTTKPWIIVAPGVAIVILGIALSLVSDSLLARQAARQRGG